MNPFVYFPYIIYAAEAKVNNNFQTILFSTICWYTITSYDDITFFASHSEDSSLWPVWLIHRHI